MWRGVGAHRRRDGGWVLRRDDRGRARGLSIPERGRFCIASARNEQKTWQRMAASEEWKIGRVRMIALVGGRGPRPGADRDSAAPPEEGSAWRWCAARRSRRSAPPRRACPRRSRMRKRLWLPPCADSAGRRNCRSAPCRRSSVGRRAQPRSPRAPWGRSQPPLRCGRRWCGCLRP